MCDIVRRLPELFDDDVDLAHLDGVVLHHSTVQCTVVGVEVLVRHLGGVVLDFHLPV